MICSSSGEVERPQKLQNSAQGAFTAVKQGSMEWMTTGTGCVIMPKLGVMLLMSGEG
jgi:hypothetical protein